MLPVASTAASISVPGVSAKPHVVLILADDLGIGDLRAYAGKDTVIETPNIDRLFAGGVKIDRYYVQPYCSPTRSALLTGRYPIRYGMQNLVLGMRKPYTLFTNETLIAQSFQAAGYKTHAFGKWHIGYCSWEATPSFRGFDTHYGYFQGELNYFTQMKQKYFDWHRASRPNCGEDCLETVWSANGTYNTYLIRDEAVSTINAHDPQTAPLFMYVAFENPHAPCGVTSRWIEPYKQKVHNSIRQIYAGVVTAMDDAIGRILDALQAKQMLQDTIVVFSADNGAPVYVDMPPGAQRAMQCDFHGTWNQDTGGTNYPYRGAKGTLYEGGVRGAAVVHYPPKLKAGVRFAGPMHITDWYPTLLSAAGIPDAAQARAAFPLDGMDMWSALTAGAPGRETFLVDYDPEHIGGGVMIHGRQKLYVGGPFKNGNWQFPPEVGVARGWSMAQDPKKGEPINCPQGCVRDIVSDPQERDAPAPASPELMALFRRITTPAVLPSLRARFTVDDPRADEAAQAHGGVWWPFGCEGMGVPPR